MGESWVSSSWKNQYNEYKIFRILSTIILIHAWKDYEDNDNSSTEILYKNLAEVNDKKQDYTSEKL